MKVRNLQLAIVAVIALSLTSCGNKKTEKETSFDETIVNETTGSEIEEIVDEPADNHSEEIKEVVTISKGGEDWDAYLKSYEEFINQYIKLLEKSKSGDMSALMEYAGYMEKASDLQEKMEKAKSELSPAQMTKFLKLQNKLIKAASEMK